MDPASSSPAEEPPPASVVHEAAPPARLHALNYRAVRHLTPMQRAGFMARGIWHMLGGIVLLTMAIVCGIAAVGLVIGFVVSLMRRAPVLTSGFLILFAFLYTYAMLLARRRNP
jgi:hypothetical protein